MPLRKTLIIQTPNSSYNMAPGASALSATPREARAFQLSSAVTKCRLAREKYTQTPHTFTKYRLIFIYFSLFRAEAAAITVVIRSTFTDGILSWKPALHGRGADLSN